MKRKMWMITLPMIRYGRNKWIEFSISNPAYWHNGIATLSVWKYFKIEELEDDELYSNWWKFYPILGRRNKGETQ